METHENIKHLREKNGLSQEKLAELVGYKDRSSIAKIEAGLVDLSQSKIALFANALNVTPAYLMGIDESFESGKTSIPASKNSSRILSSDTLSDVVSFPVVGSICAGYNGLAQEEYTGDSEELPRSMFRGYPQEELRVFRVSGDSMYPRFLDGDRVLVHAQPSVDNGDVAVVCYNGDEATLKRVYTFRDHIDLVPYNPEYKTKRIDGPDMFQVHVFGKVLKLIRDV